MFLRMLILTLFLTHYSFASAIMTDKSTKNAHFTMAYLHDETSTLTINEVSKQDFTHKTSNQFTLGYHENTIWFKIIIDNKSKQEDFVLNFTEPFWSNFNLFKPTKDGWVEEKNGLFTPINDRSIQSANPAFAVKVPSGKSKEYYIKGETINGQLGAFEVFTRAEYFRPSRISITSFYQLYTSVLFIIIILNLFLLIQMKNLINIYYIGYALTYVVFISMFSGSYLYFDMDPWPAGLHTMGAIFLIFMALFSTSFLKLEQYFPQKKKLLQGFIVIFVILGILMALNTPHITVIFNIFAFTFMLLLLFLAIQTWRLGKIKTNYYLSALIIYMPTMGMMALTFDGVIVNNDFTRYTFLFGAMIELILFSMILASQYHVSKYGEIRIQAELLVQKQKNEELLQTELKNQNQLLEDRNAMLLQQSRHAQMGEMIGMIAHQWRQPLASISAIVASLEMKILFGEGECNETYTKEQLLKISDYTQHLSQTINDFREFFKEDKKPSKTTLTEIIESSLSIMKPTLIANKISIKTEYLSNAELLTYPHELRQVVLNLFKNSQEIFEEMKLKNGAINIKTYEEDKHFYIQVEDNAGGIPEAIIDKIFDPYFTTKGDLNGTGLGLYMSKKIIVEHCNGTIEVENINGGARFTITL